MKMKDYWFLAFVRRPNESERARVCVCVRKSVRRTKRRGGEGELAPPLPRRAATADPSNVQPHVAVFLFFVISPHTYARRFTLFAHDFLRGVGGLKSVI